MSEKNKIKKERSKKSYIIPGSLDDCSSEPHIRRGSRDNKRRRDAPRKKRDNSQEMSRSRESNYNQQGYAQTSKKDTYSIIGFICKNEPGTIYIPIVQLRQSQGKRRSEASRSEQRDLNKTNQHHNLLTLTAHLSNQQNIFRQDSRPEDKRSKVEKAPRQENINDSKGENNETRNANIENGKETIGKIGGNIMDCCHAFLGTTTHSAIMDGMSTVETVNGVKDYSLKDTTD